MIENAIKRLKAKLSYQPVGLFVKISFQNWKIYIYVIWNEIDRRRNFRKKIFKLQIIERADKVFL
jgi:hypothetical protein